VEKKAELAMRSVYTKVMLAICDFHQNGSACYSHFLDKSALLAIPKNDRKGDLRQWQKRTLQKKI
jgi:hypothetical protein